MAEIELDRLGIHGVGRTGPPEQPLCLRVRFHKLDSCIVAPCQSQIVERHLVNRENRDRCAVLGTHVAERRPIRDCQMLEACAEELDEFADYSVFSKPFRDGEHEVGGRRAFQHPARETKPEDRRDQHRDRLAEHRGLGFDAANTPTDHAKPVDHGGMRIGAHQRVWIGDGAVGPIGRYHDSGEILQIHLVNDAGIGRHDPEVPKRVLPPAKKRVTLLIARELELGVQFEGIRLSEVIHLHRVVDDELHRLERVDTIGIAAEAQNPITHGGEIHDGRHPGKVLKQNPRRRKRNFLLHGALDVPTRQSLNVGSLDEAAVFMT